MAVGDFARQQVPTRGVAARLEEVLRRVARAPRLDSRRAVAKDGRGRWLQKKSKYLFDYSLIQSASHPRGIRSFVLVIPEKLSSWGN